MLSRRANQLIRLIFKVFVSGRVMIHSPFESLVSLRYATTNKNISNYTHIIKNSSNYEIFINVEDMSRPVTFVLI